MGQNDPVQSCIDITPIWQFHFKPKYFELGLVSFTKFLELSIGFLEYFESSHLDIYNSNYAQFTKGCQNWNEIQKH